MPVTSQLLQKLSVQHCHSQLCEVFDEEADLSLTVHVAVVSPLQPVALAVLERTLVLLEVLMPSATQVGHGTCWDPTGRLG